MNTSQQVKQPKSLAEWATDSTVMASILVVGLCAGWFALQEHSLKEAQRYEVHAGWFTTYFTDEVTTEKGYVNFIDASSENSISLPVKNIKSIIDRERQTK